ncbi:MAG: hypothetical protein HY360_17640 [Verrucomicrobia bacterium]|nr:hypothetical protein [Verrucomicrobiota bacterium]
MQSLKSKSPSFAMAVCILAVAQALCAQETEGDRPSGASSRWGGSQQGCGMGPQGMMMQRMMSGNSSVAISVADGSVFVVSQGQLFKFDDKTLNLQASASLSPKPKMEGGPAGSAGEESGPPGQGPQGQGGHGARGEGQRGFPSGGAMGGGGAMMASGGAAISVADGFVYIVSHGKLLKFDARSLELQTSVELERKPDPKAARPKPKKPGE